MAVAAASLFFLMAMTFFDVLLRSALNDPIEAAPELTRMSVAIIVFASLPVLSARGGHISVDLLDGDREISVIGEMRPFKIHLLGGVIDLLVVMGAGMFVQQ